MAALQNKNTLNKINLRPQHIFGRHATSHTYLSSKDASRMHAVISWDGEFWLLKDSSANGTYVNLRKIQSGIHYPINVGDVIHFGSLASDTWQLLDLDPPQSMLIPLNFEGECQFLDTLIALPSEEEPEVIMYQDNSDFWVCESEAGSARLKSGDVVGTSKFTWQFIEAAAGSQTQALDRSNIGHDIHFHFEVSQNEEHVSIVATVNDQIFDLGERNHHYLLLILARQRLADRANRVSLGEQGWVKKDALCTMLRMSEYHVNTQIYRLRKQLSTSFVDSQIPHQIIERRSCELRFSYPSIFIEGGCRTQAAKKAIKPLVTQRFSNTVAFNRNS